MNSKILMIGPPGFAPVRHYRGEGVLERLTKIDPGIQILYPQSQEPWLDVVKADLVYFIRATSPVEIRVAETAFRMGIPVWYDADDDYFNVSEDSPAYLGFQNGQVREVITWFIQNADVMTVSTGDLQRKYGEIRPKDAKPIEVVPNALDDHCLDLETFPDLAPDRCLSWRGGATHQADLWDFAEEFWDFLERSSPEWRLVFIGYSPKFIKDGFHWRPKSFAGRVKMFPYLRDYFAFLESFRFRHKPWAHLIPLNETPFNRSKSNIGALEAIYAGAVPIVPDWEEWQFPGVLKYSKIGEFAGLMQKATRISPDSRKGMWEVNMKHIREKYALSVVNQKRVRIISELLGSGVTSL